VFDAPVRHGQRSPYRQSGEQQKWNGILSENVTRVEVVVAVQHLEDRLKGDTPAICS